MFSFEATKKDKSEERGKAECYTTNYAFRFLINLFGIFRVEMRRQFSTDVNVSCSAQLIAFAASASVESYENFNLLSLLGKSQPEAQRPVAASRVAVIA